MIIGALIVACFGTYMLVIEPNRAKIAKLLRKRKNAKALPAISAEDSAELRQWKQVFRETVLSAEGKLSREMEDFLADSDEVIARYLAKAKIAAEKDRAEVLKQAEAEAAAILEKAKAERAEILGENEDDSIQSRRPLLTGAALKEFRDDYGACQTSTERGDVIKRWHAKGYRFSRKMRRERLERAGNEEWRAILRQMFDEQDADVEPAKERKV